MGTRIKKQITYKYLAKRKLSLTATNNV